MVSYPASPISPLTPSKRKLHVDKSSEKTKPKEKSATKSAASNLDYPQAKAAAKKKVRTHAAKSAVEDTATDTTSETETLPTLRGLLHSAGPPEYEPGENGTVQFKTEQGKSFWQVRQGKVAICQATKGHFPERAEEVAKALFVFVGEGWSKVQLQNAKTLFRRRMDCKTPQ